MREPGLDRQLHANNMMVNCTSMSIDGNTFYGSIPGFSSSQFPANTYLTSRPTGQRIFLRPNQYEPGRANITIYNWDLKPAVEVDLSAILAPGDRFEIRNVQDFFGEPVVSGTYEGGAGRDPHDRTDGGRSRRLARSAAHGAGVQRVRADHDRPGSKGPAGAGDRAEDAAHDRTAFRPLKPGAALRPGRRTRGRPRGRAPTRPVASRARG